MTKLSERIVIEPLTDDTFSPFGNVIEAVGTPEFVINTGMCERFHNRAEVDFDAQGRAGISLFKSQCFELPLALNMVERHPLGSQAFIPMSGGPYLVVAALDDDGKPGTLRAFVASASQGINLRRGTWHGVLTPLGGDGLFAVIDRIGTGENCDVHSFRQPVWIIDVTHNNENS